MEENLDFLENKFKISGQTFQNKIYAVKCPSSFPTISRVGNAVSSSFPYFIF